MIRQPLVRIADFIRAGLRVRNLFRIGVVVSMVALSMAPDATSFLTFLFVFIGFTDLMLFSTLRLYANQLSLVFDRKHKLEYTNDPDVELIARLMGAPLKKIRITYNEKVTAYTNILTGEITVGWKWLQKWTLTEYLAVMVHELTHLKYVRRYFLENLIVMGLTMGFIITIVMMAFNTLPPIVQWLSALAFMTYIAQFFARKNELRADLEASKIVGPDAMISALETLGERFGYKGDSESHPSVAKRIRELLKQWFTRS